MSSIPTVPSWRWHTAEVMAPMAVLIPIFSTEQHHQANNISAKWKIYGQMTSTLEIGMQQNFQWHQLQLVFFPLHPLSPLDKFLPLPLFQHVENRERLDNFVSFASCSTSWKQRLDKKNFLLPFFPTSWQQRLVFKKTTVDLDNENLPAIGSRHKSLINLSSSEFWFYQPSSFFSFQMAGRCLKHVN